MARTPEGRRLTAGHRQAQLQLRAATLRDLLLLWRAVDPTNLSGTVNSFTAAAAVLARMRHGQSAEMAVDYYRVLRATEGVRGSVTIIPPDPPTREAASEALRGAALAGIINGRRRGFSVEAAAQNGFVKASGAMSTLVLAGARQTILESVRGDRRAAGWQRVTAGGCDFCETLSTRVFGSSESADFAAHDHCACAAEPVF